MKRTEYYLSQTQTQSVKRCSRNWLLRRILEMQWWAILILKVREYKLHAACLSHSKRRKAVKEGKGR
jgi:hypothetical protein